MAARNNAEARHALQRSGDIALAGALDVGGRQDVHYLRRGVRYVGRAAAGHDDVGAGYRTVHIARLRGRFVRRGRRGGGRSEEHTSELQSLMRISYAVFSLKQKKPHYYYNLVTGIQAEYRN